jgi:Cu/Ag efflux protein CusF
MNARLRLATSAALVLATVTPLLAIDVGGCCRHDLPTPAPAVPAETPPPSTAPAGHPLRGVIVDVLADKQALLVKHEEIPGVMKAMTMLLKTDAATLASAKKGQTITATLLDKDDGWWLADVKVVAPLPAE